MAILIVGQAQAVRPNLFSLDAKATHFAIGEKRPHVSAIGRGRGGRERPSVPRIYDTRTAFAWSFQSRLPQHFAALGVEAVDLAGLLVGPGEEHVVARDYG